IGFGDSGYDETAHAATVACHLETDHRELIVRPDATSTLNRLVWHYNEPFADSSALPTMAVAALARTEVTVALNGDGGDEAFVGYERYLALDAAGRVDALPKSARRLLAAGTALLPAGEPKTWSYRARRFGKTLGGSPAERF